MTQPRTPPPTLSFDEIKTRRKGQVEFPTVAYRDFTEVKRQISPFSRKMEANLEVFRDQLFARIKAVNGLDVERAIVYWVAAHGKHRLRCIAYQTGRRVFPLAFDPARFAALLDEFLALRKHRGAAPKPAAVDAWQARLEQQVGARLPEAFTALYRRLGGAAGLFFDNDLLTMEAVEREWAGWRKIYEEWSLRALRDGHTSEKGATYPVYCTARWIPFIDLVGGNFVALDLIPTPRGHYGQIIVFGADVQCIRRIAGDLPQFLQLCLGYKGRKGHPLHDVVADLAV